MRKFFVVILAVILVFGMTSLAGAEKIFKVGIGEDPTTLNMWSALGPGESSMYNYVVLNDLYDSIYGICYPSYNFVPRLAQGDPGEFVKEGEYYTSIVPLRKGIFWSDGNEFTADDVVFTYQTMIDFDLLGNWSDKHPDVLVKVEKVDDYQVKYYLKDEPGLAEWNFGILQATIMPKANWEGVVEEAVKQDNPTQYLYSHDVKDLVTINGLDFGKWEKGAFFQTVAVKDFRTGDVTRIYENGRHEIEGLDLNWSAYGEAGSELKYEIAEGPFVDSAIYRLYSNQEAMIMALKKGDIDYLLSAQGLTKGFRRELEGTAGIEVVTNPSNGFRYMCFNRARYPFDIMEFNQAVATLIDRDYVMNQVLQGAGVPLATAVPPGNSYWYNPAVKIWGEGLTRAQRVDEAVKLLAGAGFTWEVKPAVDLENDTYNPGSGIVLPNGEKMQAFEILTPPAGYDPMRATWGLWIQLWLQDIGFPVIARPTQFNVILEKVNHSKDYDAYILGWGLGGSYPDHLDAFFASDGGHNRNDFKDPVFDTIIKSFMKATEIETARGLAFEAQERLAITLPYIVLFSTPIYDAYRKDVIEFPAKEVLDGIQGFYGVPRSVQIIN